MQQHTLNRANAYAAEALAQPLTVAAHAARPQMLQEYSARVRAYLEVRLVRVGVRVGVRVRCESTPHACALISRCAWLGLG